MLKNAVALLLLLLPAVVVAQTAGQLPTVGIAEIDGSINAKKAADFATMIEGAIARSGRFRVIERTQMRTLISEQARCMPGGPVAPAAGCQAIGISPVQYVIYGTVSLESKQGGGFLVADVLGCLVTNCPKSTDTISVDLKISELPSGWVRRAVTLKYSEKSGTNYFEDSLFRGAAELITTNLVREIFPIAVVLVRQDGSLLLNYGSGTLQTGQYLMAYQMSAPVPDPVTPGRVIRDKQATGILKVTAISSDTATAVYDGGGAGPIQAGQIVEPMTTTEAQAALRAYRGAKWRPG